MSVPAGFYEKTRADAERDRTLTKPDTPIFLRGEVVDTRTYAQRAARGKLESPPPRWLLYVGPMRADRGGQFQRSVAEYWRRLADPHWVIWHRPAVLWAYPKEIPWEYPHYDVRWSWQHERGAPARLSRKIAAVRSVRTRDGRLIHHPEYAYFWATAGTHPLAGMVGVLRGPRALLAPGECADGSGAWLPAYKPDGTLIPVCPSSRWYRRVRAYHREHGGHGPVIARRGGRVVLEHASNYVDRWAPRAPVATSGAGMWIALLAAAAVALWAVTRKTGKPSPEALAAVNRAERDLVAAWTARDAAALQRAGAALKVAGAAMGSEWQAQLEGAYVRFVTAQQASDAAAMLAAVADLQRLGLTELARIAREQAEAMGATTSGLALVGADTVYSDFPVLDAQTVIHDIIGGQAA